ncbi:MAG: sigma-70 family RNA polymerase sigma factor [Gemmataceae bacterium]
MPESYSPLRQFLYRLKGRADSAGPDAELLERYRGGDQSAFRSLVERHGAMVLAVCRRQLGEHDAEDAFQATFLVLARKAGALDGASSLASWLYTVARNLAVDVRLMESRRRQREERVAAARTEAALPGSKNAREVQDVLDDELTRLPEKYRAPLVLCLLEGKTHDEAARELGWPRGSMAKRLERGQELLRERLVRRGLALSAVSALLAEASSSQAQVAISLVDHTTQAALDFAAGLDGPGSRAAQLAQGALRIMFRHKMIKQSVVVLLFVGLVGLGAGLLLREANAEQEKRPLAARPRPQISPAQLDKDRFALVEGNTEFAVDLYKKLKDRPGNLVFSPISISTCYGLVYAGAEGETAEEMAKTLHFTVPEERVHPAFSSLLTDYNGTGQKRPYKLRVVNGLWGLKAFPFRKEFLDDAGQFYAAGLLREYDNLHDGTARREINHWVSKQTEGKIPELLPVGQPRAQSRRVLGNAVYFLGTWQAKFDEKQTQNKPFHISAREKVDVPMMYLRWEDQLFQNVETMPYWKGDGVEVLEMPYKGKDLSLVVMLPIKKDGLAEVEKDLTAKKLQQWLRNLGARTVEIALPRFKVKTSVSLPEVLSELGMRKLFQPGEADLSRMGGEGEWIDTALHQAVIEVNEKGTEAAAATVNIAAGADRVHFNADHPFLFLIRDRRNNSILFLGRVVKPE